MNEKTPEELYNMDYVYYAHGTYAYYESKTNTYFNDFGQELRNPCEYDTSDEGYTPFGDE